MTDSANFTVVYLVKWCDPCPVAGRVEIDFVVARGASRWATTKTIVITIMAAAPCDYGTDLTATTVRQYLL